MITKRELEVLKLRKHKLTQIEVAKKLKISQAAVSKFEKNALAKIIAAKKIIKLASELKIEVDDEI